MTGIYFVFQSAFYERTEPRPTGSSGQATNPRDFAGYKADDGAVVPFYFPERA